MDQAAAHAVAPARAVFKDGFGERFRSTQPGTNEQIEVLRLRHELTGVPSFEFALRERMGRLASFKHTAFGRVRSIERLRDPAPGIAVVSDAVPGVRLVDLLKANERGQFAFDINVAGNLIRQLMSAVAMLHANTGGIAHGAIGPERIIITPKARVVIVEHVLAGALEELGYTSERYWRELRVVGPPSGQPRSPIDWSSDLAQVAVVALALVIGRPLQDDEYPAAVERLMASTPAALVSWLKRAMLLDTREPFSSAMQAQTELAKVFDDGDASTISQALEGFVAQRLQQVDELEDQRPKTAAASARVPVVSAPVVPRPTLVAAPEPASVAEPIATLSPKPVSDLSLRVAGVLTWVRDRDWKATSGVAGLVLALAVGGYVAPGGFGTGRAASTAKSSRAKATSADPLASAARSGKLGARTDSVDEVEHVDGALRSVDRLAPPASAARPEASAAVPTAGSDVAAVSAPAREQPAPVASNDVASTEVKIPSEPAIQPQVAEPPVTTGLRDLGAGQTELPPPPAKPEPAAPAAAEATARAASRVYGAADPGVIPPAAIRQALPPFPGLVKSPMRGTVEVVINESGTVESAQMREHITAAYDKEVLGAIASWRYRPATVNGVPVKFRKVIGVTVDKR